MGSTVLVTKDNFLVQTQLENSTSLEKLSLFQEWEAQILGNKLPCQFFKGILLESLGGRLDLSQQESFNDSYVTNLSVSMGLLTKL